MTATTPIMVVAALLKKQLYQQWELRHASTSTTSTQYNTLTSNTLICNDLSRFLSFFACSDGHEAPGRHQCHGAVPLPTPRYGDTTYVP